MRWPPFEAASFRPAGRKRPRNKNARPFGVAEKEAATSLHGTRTVCHGRFYPRASSCRRGRPPTRPDPTPERPSQPSRIRRLQAFFRFRCSTDRTATAPSCGGLRRIFLEGLGPAMAHTGTGWGRGNSSSAGVRDSQAMTSFARRVPRGTRRAMGRAAVELVAQARRTPAPHRFESARHYYALSRAPNHAWRSVSGGWRARGRCANENARGSIRNTNGAPHASPHDS